MSTEYTEELIEKIKKEGIKMKPKFRFVLKMLLMVLGILITILFAVYLVSLISFISKGSGLGLLPPFGLRGFGLILIGLPWLLIGLSGASILILQILVKKFSFSYREPVLYSLIGIIIFVLFGGMAFGKVGLHERLLDRVEREEIPILREVYRSYGPPIGAGFNAGTLLEIGEKDLLVETINGDEIRVQITDDTHLPFGGDFEVGQEIVVVGKAENGLIKAFGIRGVSEAERPFGPKRRFR
ncbi:MAG: hypothetical protein COT89_00445 [Candidatus Colwellbacteria bacterium CG10_big_fil_rev_8_21_14_0_10_42_22]|uniref:Uncharacterized protein n=1 Tax=Candidatus Colwellbacteria bacterium CG10_big_fil_rev_8_21_14_0_10_42_22 TaxID=1974540 RepID=A0A2H0VIN2_9BACT|nr:MAG: hypothetical protein COT89_00445 [Candidatus Colwellbacteria bacterium CG10_big_fil_rev_8_21_14_0_10_42_22]